MTLRCGCYDQADDIVFGPRHQCTSKPALVAAESVHADNISIELRRLERPADECDGMDSPERPYERTLSDGDGDLG